MYASPTVLIFSNPSSSTNPSKVVKTPSSRDTSSVGDIPADIGVKSTTSAKSTDTDSNESAIVALLALSLVTISSGRMLCSRSFYRFEPGRVDERNRASPRRSPALLRRG
jgi:hypothetical protein